ncbi:GNAT family N-acetyltransferase [Bradyrhizobium sp. PMVTL-01]|uniref:GNAT family N-acetyltransferase n=1 Tax=Bradyrhizobium sp. PMVTL-01 TaxID=3434999 RepID=UPI003F72F8F8
MDLKLEPIVDELPAGFADLEADATADGHRQMTCLAAELTETPAFFHAAYACCLGGRLAGIGAMTDEPAPTAQPTWRMRRFYVHREFRRRQVAFSIAMALLQDAAGKVSTMTVHAGNQAAAQFWEAIGFRRVADLAWSHQRTMRDTTAGQMRSTAGRGERSRSRRSPTARICHCAALDLPLHQSLKGRS